MQSFPLRTSCTQTSVGVVAKAESCVPSSILASLTNREREVWESVPLNDWLNQFEIRTSKGVLSHLVKLGLLRKRRVDNPTRDPRLGFVYQRRTD